MLRKMSFTIGKIVYFCLKNYHINFKKTDKMKTSTPYPFFIFWFIICMNPLIAQQDIRLDGLVVMQNSKYKLGKVAYISDVNLHAPFSIPTKSDSRGHFNLIFSDKPLGNTIPISARKAGLKVVNSKVLEAAAVLGRTEALKVVMCTEEDYEENIAAYYNISQNAIKRTYERRVNVLQKANEMEQRRLMDSLQIETRQVISSKEEAIRLLDEQKTVLQKQAQELADRFVVTNLDDESAIYQTAFESFTKGDLSKAILILNNVNWQNRLQSNKEQIEKRKLAIKELKQKNNTSLFQLEQDRRSCILAANLYQLNYRLDSTRFYYELAIQFDLDSTDIDVINNYTKLLFDYRELTLALHYNDMALTRLQTLRTTADSARYTEGYAMALYHRQMILARNVDAATETEAICLTTIPLFKQLSETDSNKLLKLGMIYANLGQARHYQDKNDVAVLPYQQSLIVLNNPVRPNDSVERLFIKSFALSGLGVVMRDLNKFDTAIVLCQEAVDIRHELTLHVDSLTYRNYYIQALNNLATVYEYKGDENQAIYYLKMALVESQKGSSFNPRFNSVEVIRISLNLANVYIKLYSLNLAEDLVDSAQSLLPLIDKNSFENISYNIQLLRRKLVLHWIGENNLQKAETNGLKVLALFPNSDNAKAILWVALVFNNKKAEADNILHTIGDKKNLLNVVDAFIKNQMNHLEFDRIRQIYGK